MTPEDYRITILYGSVLDIYGVPHDFPLFVKHGSRIFDKRTRLYREANEIRRQQLKEEYGLAEMEQA